MARKPRRAPPEKPANAKQSIKNIFSLLTGYKLKLSLTVICGIISTVFSVISPLLIGFATTAIFDGINSGNMNLNHIINLLIAIVILYIISAVFSGLRSPSNGHLYGSALIYIFVTSFVAFLFFRGHFPERFYHGGGIGNASEQSVARLDSA